MGLYRCIFKKPKSFKNQLTGIRLPRSTLLNVMSIRITLFNMKIETLLIPCYKLQSVNLDLTRCDIYQQTGRSYVKFLRKQEVNTTGLCSDGRGEY